MYLSLPLPSTATWTMTVTIFYGDGSGLPMQYIILVLKHGITLEQKAKKEGKVIKEVNKDNFKGSERKLFLTPLVTYLEGTQTGADIDLAISRVLSPLRKKTYFSSTIVHIGKENGSAVEAIDESANIYATHSGLGNQLMDKF
ncbi:Ubiquitin carboxyl-terminal hydrolase 9 [Camellia lanceoleosa]|uniref:Ubiquitin carboxyl-terminal hydrolase 9 n=1 Tax=Camellia lanceoleosa TaxID=1840588 RepID=A0ACC0HNK2_9ERIC|nr:Ubiquitin carboxyl-terminal hydrolase 9 [Camellia lanceoleosa]